jgi:hypothetical protein
MRNSSFGRWLPLLVWATAACGGPQKAGNAGAVCFRDDDCALGLVCAIPEGGTARVCTSDVGGLISEVDAGIAYGGAATAGSAAGGAASGGTPSANGGTASPSGGGG